MSFFSTYERKQLVAIPKGYVTMEFPEENFTTSKKSAVSAEPRHVSVESGQVCDLLFNLQI